MAETAEVLEAPSARAAAAAVLLGNAREGLEARFLAERLLRGRARTILFVAHDLERARAVAERVLFWAPELETLVLPAWDCLPYDRTSPTAAVMAERLAVLARLAEASERPRLVVSTANAILQRVPPPEVVRSGRLVLEAGRRIGRETLVGWLEREGYQRVGTVVEPGEYAVRGGLLDLFPTGGAKPVRLDFFGEVVESIRHFDPASQRSAGKLARLELVPASEVVLDAAAIERFRIGFLREFGAVTDDPLLEAVSAGRRVAGMEHWLPLFHERLVTLLDYLPERAELAFDHLAMEAIRERAALIGEHYEARRNPPVATGFGTAPYRPLPPERLYLDEQSFGRLIARRARFFFSRFAPPPAPPAGIDRCLDLEGKPARDFAAERTDRGVNLFDAVVAHLRSLLAAGQKPLLVASSEGALERLKQVLEDHGPVPLRRVANARELEAGEGVALAVLPLEHGVVAPGLHILTEQDLLGERLARPARRARRADRFIQDLAAIAEGDLLVHAEHGIGRFEGLVTLEIGGAPHDCLKLVYAGGDKLFVPVENLEILSRYGHADEAVPLDKLGGAGWQQRKAKIKERIRELAHELVKIAAERATRKAPALELPPGIYDEFVARFPYEETEDQLRAIEAVLADMASGRPMDRLVCGDVGFGKTEVALRAAFVAAMSGKQVAVLAPTTLLARQHYKVFSERFRGLPIRIGHLSRMVSAREAEAVKKGLAAGEIEIAIGTHALLGKGVSFKDLGLVVIDEEQHFGVVHKEKLKQLRAEVHVLTMTATPIPRTLQMALGGMKDLSVIATPPVDRLAVRAFVMPVDPVVIREALLREHHRGGQSFYVCPRIADQPKLKETLDKLVPELKVGVAHGRMPVAELEDVMSAFYDQKLDVLLATNIIESGLDIPTANTLVVHRADLFGLSQLYQLRGRIGRSKVRGYAYFTVPADKKLAETAQKRLQVIQSLEGLGAGFQLASHDLDIRGAGNLLGEEQSGHIKEVGFELYNAMLEEAVAELQRRREAGEVEAAGDWTPQITIDAAALMPEAWIGDLDLRLSLYRRLASLAEPRELDAFAAELVDRFGPLPEETKNLLEIVAIKQLCRKANVAKLDAGPKGMVLSFHDNRFPHPERLVAWIGRSGGRVRIRPDHKLVLAEETDSPQARLKKAKRLVAELAKLAA
ncbi:MAG: transcription-repair coupling factor [Geminicoccaceae bacterium]|nr:transcription-repair coupling factor [Geminicoccaceae bacterium]MCX8100929.1 transcription-repair coupling factor [Geminicoccaceae bacterium]MDW8368644.1 transcription-repair coupling factor [Geminicoccaceae bacterium]